MNGFSQPILLSTTTPQQVSALGVGAAPGAAGTGTFTGIVVENAGTNTAGSAGVTTPVVTITGTTVVIGTVSVVTC